MSILLITVIGCNDNETDNANQSLSYMSSEQRVFFLDSNVESAIRMQIDKPTGDITKSDLETITNLTLSRVTDLTGLEYCTNLTYLDLNVWSDPVWHPDKDGMPGGVDTPVSLNSVYNIYPLVENSGFGKGDTVDLRSNELSNKSLEIYVPILRERGVEVLSDPWTTSIIEIVFSKSWLLANDKDENPRRIDITFPRAWVTDSPKIDNGDTPVKLYFPKNIFENSNPSTDSDEVNLNIPIDWFVGY